ncbi:MAG: hypothetical protein K2I82_01820 [Ruminococcus sp.]|nr:hypothetical protein [Ruminococcus sp.]
MIKADVKYTAEHFKEVQVIVIPFKQRILWLVLTALSTAFAVYAVLTGEKFFNIFTVLAMILMFGILVYIISNYVILNPQKMFERYNESQPDGHIIFEFDENSLKMTNQSSTANGVGEYRYDIFETAWEKQNFFIIQIKAVGQVVIKKSEITDGTPDELRQFLKDKLGDKFKIKFER